MGFIKIKKKTVLNLIIIFIINLFPIIWIIQENPRVQARITEKLIFVLQQEWQANISVESYDINFFTGIIFLKGGTVSSFNDLNKNFVWNFKEAKISFSRLDYFIKDYFLLDVIFKDVNVITGVSSDGQLDINNHLEKIVLTDSSIGGKLRSVIVSNINLKIDHKSQSVIINLDGKFGIKKFGNPSIGQHWSGFIFFKNGLVSLNNKVLINNINLNSTFSEHDYLLESFTQNISGTFCFLNDDYSIKGTKNNIKIEDKKGIMNLVLDFDTKGFNGEFILSNLNYPLLNKSKWRGNIKFSFFDDKRKISLTNFDKINLFDSWFIGSGEFKLRIILDKEFNFRTTYKILGKKRDIEKRTFYCNGKCFFNDGDLKTIGFIGNDYFRMDLSLNPFLYLKKVLYIKGNRKLINFYSEKNFLGLLIGNIDISFFRFFLPQSINRYILGNNAKFCLKLDQSKDGFLLGNGFLKGSKLAILKSYNPIENFKFDFVFDNSFKKLFLNNFLITLFKGKIFAPNIQVGFDDNFDINYFQMPLKIKNLFINWKKNFYGILNGNLNFNQNNKSWTDISGDLVFKRALFKEYFENLDNKNIINYSLLSKPILLGKNIVNVDVNITNLMPIRVNTGIANLDINSDFKLQLLISDGQFFNPKLMGSFVIKKGVLDFLHNKLFIDYGKIQFIPNRLNDPIVDLIAKNKINKYLVTLHVTGSLNNPKIMLESFPKLKKEQILALLVAGSKDANFKAQITQILQRNLGQLNSSSTLLKKLTQPFRFIQITPSFATQTSRGGLKGSLDIDLNDQIHASVQKNFNLQDDLSFQIDYFVTDDVNIQFLKDQRGELGAQVEVILTL